MLKSSFDTTIADEVVYQAASKAGDKSIFERQLKMFCLFKPDHSSRVFAHLPSINQSINQSRRSSFIHIQAAAGRSGTRSITACVLPRATNGSRRCLRCSTVVPVSLALSVFFSPRCTPCDARPCLIIWLVCIYIYIYIKEKTATF